MITILERLLKGGGRVGREGLDLRYPPQNLFLRRVFMLSLLNKGGEEGRGQWLIKANHTPNHFLRKMIRILHLGGAGRGGWSDPSGRELRI